MRRWWMLIAGVLGIGLAVLLVRSPDTGGDIPEGPEYQGPDPSAQWAPRDDGPIVYDDDDEPREGEPSPAAVGDGTADAGEEPVEQERRMSPAARRVQELRNTPEAQTAARVSAPWTQVRRVLQGTGQEELATEANALLQELREMRRDPAAWDWSEMEQRQRALMAKIRQSGHSDAEVERMFGLIDERLGEYHAKAE